MSAKSNKSNTINKSNRNPNSNENKNKKRHEKITREYNAHIKEQQHNSPYMNDQIKTKAKEANIFGMKWVSTLALIFFLGLFFVAKQGVSIG